MNKDWPALSWDIFCRVIDNLGDVGLCWRLCRELAARGQRLRLWLDQIDALRWMAPGAVEGRWPGIEVVPWERNTGQVARSRSDVWVESLGCEPPTDFILQQRSLWPQGAAPVWVNLEYLSAESYVQRMHRLPSPLLSGPAQGWTRWFFYPGFTSATGGLLREADLPARQAAFDRRAWRESVAGQALGRLSASAPVPQAADPALPQRWVSLFCYEPAGLPWLLQTLQHDPAAILLLTPGRADAAVQGWLGAHEHPARWLRRPLVEQPAFDEMLWACDLNFVRGEDSLVRALLSGQALVWNIYPQHDNAHHAKLQAFLDWLDAPVDLRQLHWFWNGIAGQAPPDLAPERIQSWAAITRHARERLLSQTDLANQLLAFVSEKR